MPHLLVIQPGEKLASLSGVDGDFAHWVVKGMGLGQGGVQVVHPHRGEPLPQPASVQAAVITGSSAMVTDRSDWMEATSAWLRAALDAGMPLLGICFGHQLLAQACGGRVADNPRGAEVGTLEVRLHPAAASDPLLGELPGRLRLHLSHRQSVIELPPGAVALAESNLEPHQAFVLGGHAWGLQFHPEFSREIISGYLEYHAAQGGLAQDAALLRATLAQTPYGAVLLRRFARLAGLISS